jgi:uncharacterized protein YoaH (UPF0181 family)
MIGSSLHTWPVEKTMENPQGGDMHSDYVSKLGINAANVDVNTGFDIGEDGTVYGNAVPPQAFQIEPHLKQEDGFEGMFGHKQGYAFLAPLALAGGRMLLRYAVGGLMKKAISGAGNFLDGNANADQYEGQPGMNRGVGLMAHIHESLGHGAPVETPGSTPDMVEDHDPEAVDQQEFNDGDMSPAFNNPNLDGDEGGLSQSTGEDATKQKLEFRHDGDAVNQAELLLPLIMEYLHSEKSALENPQLKALHEALDAEIPDYINLADEDHEDVHKFLDALKNHKDSGVKQSIEGMGEIPGGLPMGEESIRANDIFHKLLAEGIDSKTAWQQAQWEVRQQHQAAGVYQNTPIPMQQMQMGQPQQMAMPGTHQNPVQPGGMPVSGKCMNCGSVVNADGSCPQCGAAAGANQMGNMNAANPNQTPPGIMPSPYAKTAADPLDDWYAQQGLPEGGSGSLVRECPNCHGHNMHYQAPNSPDLHLDLEQGTLNGQAPLDDTPRNTPGPFHNPGAQDDMGHFKCEDCSYTLGGEGAEADNLQQFNMREQPWGAHLPIRQGADHQGPITPQQKEVFAEYLIAQSRQDEVAAMMANPGIYADEWAQYLNRQTQPPEVDPNEAPPQPEMDPSQMGQMPMPGMSVPQPGMGGQGQMMARTADRVDLNQEYGRRVQELEAQGIDPERAMQMAQHQMRQEGLLDTPKAPNPFGPFKSKTAESLRRCPKCKSATTSPIGEDGQMHCHRCQNVYDIDMMTERVSHKWTIKKGFQDAIQPNQSPANPVAAPAAEQTAPGDREQQADSTLSWQDASGEPLQVGQVYEMHNPNYPIPDVIKVQAVKPDSITVTMEGEYNAPSDPQDPNGAAYTHEIDLNELQTEGLTFNPAPGGEGDAEQSQDQAEQDGVGQTVNTEPVEQPHDSFPVHTHVKEQPTDRCPKCEYGHVTSNYLSPELVQYECYRCAHEWKVVDEDPGAEGDLESRSWLNESSTQDEIGFDPRALAMASTGKSRNIQDIAKKDPRLAEISKRLNANKTAGAKFSPSEQKKFIDEDGMARNADLLDLEGTHYVSAFDNSKARPDKVNDAYLGLGL